MIYRLKIIKKMIGKTLDVLVESREEDGTYIGRSKYDAPEIDNSIIFKSEKELETGTIVKVFIEDAFDYDLVGRSDGR